MHVEYLLVAAAMAATALARSFSEEISGIPELSDMSMYLSNFPGVKELFDSPTNVTILALDNRAFSQLVGPNADIAEPLPNATTVDFYLSYHIIKGEYPTENITTTPEFPPTLLDNPGFENRTSGQVVQLVEKDGSAITITGLNQESAFVRPNIKYDNGIIHIIDNVLTLPQTVTSTVLAANLTSFYGALEKSNAGGKANDATDVTVFAPQTEGFRRVGSVFEGISPSDLSRIAEYHIVGGNVVYSMDMKNESLPTFAGDDLQISTIDGVAFVNSARVVSTDVLVNNGILHIISDVLNPDNTTAKPNPNADPPPVAFGGASSVQTDPLTSDVAAPTSVIPLPPAGSIGGDTTTTGPTGPTGPTTTSATETTSSPTTTSGPTTTTSPTTTTTSPSPTTTGTMTDGTTSPADAAPTDPINAGLAAVAGLGAVLMNV